MTPKTLENPFAYEEAFHQEGFSVICGVDEAGRGPLAGDVYAAAVILPPDFDPTGLNDSKKLTEKRREALYERIIREASAYCIATASPAEIDELNILEASLLAMRRAIDGLSVKPDLALIDGNQSRGFQLAARCIIGGDGKSASIAAASILAKVSRDRHMVSLAETYPGYGFEKHKGYPTAAHYEAIGKLGILPIHRKSFLKKLSTPKTEVDPIERGRYGEDAAARYLESHGYRILDRNWYSADGELDIVAQLEGMIVFVEVKQRKHSLYQTAVEAVTPSKQKKLILTSQAWLQAHECSLPARMDVIEVYTGMPQDSPFGPTYPRPEIRHIRDAFAPRCDF